MKATEHFFAVILSFIKLYKLVLNLESVDESLSVMTHIKVAEQHFHVVLFTMHWDGDLNNFQVSLDNILKCDYSHESH